MANYGNRSLSDYESGGQEFESLRARHLPPNEINNLSETRRLRVTRHVASVFLLTILENQGSSLAYGYSARHDMQHGVGEGIAALSEFQREAIKLKATQTSQIGAAGMGVIGFSAVARFTSGPITRPVVFQAAGIAVIAYVFAIIVRQIAVWRLKDLDRD